MRETHGETNMGIVTVCGIGSVSYTHLDVYKRQAEEIQAAASEIRRDVGRGDPKTRHQFQIEVPNHMLTAYLYQSMGIEPVSYTHLDVYKRQVLLRGGRLEEPTPNQKKSLMIVITHE